MPTYEYACTECGHRLEAVQKFSDDPLTECPDCAGALRKVYGAVGIVLKGSGFYKTDSRAAASNGKGKKAESGADGSSGSGSGSDSGSGSGSGSDSGSSSSSDSSGSSSSDKSSGSEKSGGTTKTAAAAK